MGYIYYVQIVYKSRSCNLERFSFSFERIDTGVDDIARSGGIVSNEMNENNLQES